MGHRTPVGFVLFYLVGIHVAITHQWWFIEAKQDSNENDKGRRYIFFMKSPTAPPLSNCSWSMLQQDPNTSFVADHLRDMMQLLGFDRSTAQNSSVRVGITFQWELLDCFLSPHECTPSQVAMGVRNFLDAAVSANVPVEITLDPVQFYYRSLLWNFFDPDLPGYDAKNVHNVEWTGWDPSNATEIAWRNWGSQFRLPTPQPNLASPAVLNATRRALKEVVSAIRLWWENPCRSSSERELLVGIKLGEEVDVAANFYFYENGNALRNESSHLDPTNGPDWSKGLFGGLMPMGYNMLQTLGLRTTGENPPSRDEISQGIQHYFEQILDSCTTAWPALATNNLLVAHAGHVGDPHLLRWDTPMIEPATPGYSFYFGPKAFPNSSEGKPNPVGQPGLRTALDAYRESDASYVVAESACFGCVTESDWKGYFDTIFRENPYGRVRYVRYYNIGAFLASPGAVDGLHGFLASFRDPVG